MDSNQSIDRSINIVFFLNLIKIRFCSPILIIITHIGIFSVKKKKKFSFFFRKISPTCDDFHSWRREYVYPLQLHFYNIHTHKNIDDDDDSCMLCILLLWYCYIFLFLQKHRRQRSNISPPPHPLFRNK